MKDFYGKLILACLALCTIILPIFADSMISEQEAKRIALARVYGEVLRVELGSTDDIHFYVVTIQTQESIVLVYINAGTGVVIREFYTGRVVHSQGLSKTEAQEIALNRVRGQVINAYEEEGVYSVYVLSGLLINKVSMNATSGQVLEVEPSFLPLIVLVIMVVVFIIFRTTVRKR